MLLGPKLGPLLAQLPPSLKVDRVLLASFLDLLAARNAASCLSDHAAAPAPWEVTADFVYIRGHGPDGRYAGTYPDHILAQWQAEIEHWRRAGKDVYVCLDNDVKCAAPHDGRRLLDRFAGEAPQGDLPH